MSSFESPYPSILQGVSQQIPKLRLDGQVSEQVNMLSDIVTNPRRRAGTKVVYNADWTGEGYLSTKVWSTDIAGQRVHVIIGTVLGNIRLLSHDMSTVLAEFNSGYLISSDPSKIRATTVGNEFYLLNVNIKPAAVPGTLPTDPAKQGFFFVKAGAFSKGYFITVTTNLGSALISYTTPNGTGTGDVAASTPEAIVAALTAGANLTALAGIGVNSVYITGAYAYLLGNTSVTSLAVASGSGSTYLTTSGASRVRLEADLPATLPAQADNYIVAVGDQKLFRYYQYKAATTEWLECGQYGSPASLSGMPISIRYVSGAWSINDTPYEGRTAGDEETNPLPEFLTRGLSGMGAFQSRLVLLGGSKVYMSSSTNARRFMRSTVTGLLDADPIAVGASANSSAEYQYAIPFQKDLLLFSDKYQALVPSAGQAITPRTATVLLTSTYSVDTLSEPVPIGRTLLFATPRSKAYFGFMEMVSSQYTDAQYVANDATGHLPKYMPGQCRYGVSSPVSSMVLFGSSDDPFTVVVYEYQWDGDKKVQQAWHKWRLPYPVATAYFSNELINLVFVNNGKIMIMTTDPREGILAGIGGHRPFMDFYMDATIVDNKVTVPAALRNFDPDIHTKLQVAVASGPLAGERVGTTGYDAGTGQFTTVRSFPSGPVYVGIPFRSSLIPSPPVRRDQNGIKIESNKFTVLRFGVTTNNSAEYKVSVTDAHTADATTEDTATLFYSSNELQPGVSRDASLSRAIIPARTDADSTQLLMYTEGLGELNFVGIDYTGRANQKIRRR